MAAGWACTEDPSLIGFRKDVPRVGIYFREFNIPVSVIQSDSVRTDNVRLTGNEPLKPDLDRIMAGSASDPLFGNITTKAYIQFLPPLIGSRLKLSNVTLDKITFTLLFDYYFYGDTSFEYSHTMQVRRINDRTFSRNRQLFASTSVNTYSDPIGQNVWKFHPDTIRKHINANTDKNTNNNVVDSLYFELSPLFGQELLTTVLNIQDTLETSSLDAFQTKFQGLAIESATPGVIMGFDPGKVSSRVRIYYSYVDNGVSKKGKYDFILSNPYCAGFTSITVDRTGTALNNLNTKFTPVAPPDGYSYIQSGTGIFAKLDFSDFYTYFDTIAKPLLNSAELIIPVPNASVRNHFQKPKSLYYTFMNNNNRFFRPVTYSEVNGKPVEAVNAQFQFTYFGEMNNDYIIRARGDDKSAIKIPYTEAADLNGYRGYLTDFFQTQLRLGSDYKKFPYAALNPSDTPFGKSLNGVSFDASQVKLRVYYSKSLVK